VEASSPYLSWTMLPWYLRTRIPKVPSFLHNNHILRQARSPTHYTMPITIRLIHLDIKPENMLIGRSDQDWLSDFGNLCSGPQRAVHRYTRAAGTAPYMAPKQIRGKPRPASDQYALGLVVLLYEFWLCLPGHSSGELGSREYSIEQHLYSA